MTTPDESLSVPGDLEKSSDELSQEVRELTASFPVEKGWAKDYDIHQYQGFWFTPRGLKATLAFQKHFQAQQTDVLLVTFPKSGTTWLKAMVFALRYRTLYPDCLDLHPLLTNNPHALVPFVDLEYLDDKVPDLSNLDPPRLFATHLPYVFLPKSVEESGCKIVYLCRNSKDNFVSLWNFANKLTPKVLGDASLELAFDRFCRGVNVYGPFWDHILSYWRKKQEAPQRVLFLQYEDLKKEPVTQLRRLSEFLDCPFSEEEESSGIMEDIVNLCSFDSLSNLEVNKTGKLSAFGIMHETFFRRGQVGDAVNYLTPEMSDKIDRITEEKFHGSGLEFLDL